MPTFPDDDTTGHRRCGRNCPCPAARGHSDLQALVSTPGFTGAVLGSAPAAVACMLPALGQAVGVTAAGPVVMNAVGSYDAPALPGGPIRCEVGRISLRLNPSRLGQALITEPGGPVPPTVRLYDEGGNIAHATYLSERSDRLAFETIALDHLGAPAAAPVPAACPAAAVGPDEDQISLFDSVLADGGVGRLAELPRHGGPDGSGFAQVDTRQVVAALEYASMVTMPVTVGAAATGCLQLHRDHLDGAREHREHLVIAAGAARVMVNFPLASACWVTWSHGVCGRTGALEVYDRSGRASLVVTQTGPVPAPALVAWNDLLTDLVA
ncbi:MAG: heme transporter [Gordonia sp. (in: high G+C Gram-positive bacteria)]